MRTGIERLRGLVKPQWCDSGQASSSDLNCAAAAISAALLYRSGFIKHESSVTTPPARRVRRLYRECLQSFHCCPRSRAHYRLRTIAPSNRCVDFRPRTCFAHPHDDGSPALSHSAMVLRSIDRRRRRSGRCRPSLFRLATPRGAVLQTVLTAPAPTLQRLRLQKRRGSQPLQWSRERHGKSLEP